MKYKHAKIIAWSWNKSSKINNLNYLFEAAMIVIEINMNSFYKVESILTLFNALLFFKCPPFFFLQYWTHALVDEPFIYLFLSAKIISKSPMKNVTLYMSHLTN